MSINSFFFSFLSFSVFLQLERERERVYKIGYKEKRSQSLLIFFSMDSYGESFFFYGLFFYPEFLALVPSTTNPVQQLVFLLSISADGKESPLPFSGPSQSFGFSLLPSCVRRLLRATRCHPVSHSLSIRSPSTNICFSILT